MYSSTAAAVLRRAELSLSGEGRQQKKNLFSAVNQPREIIRLSSSPFFFPPREREREKISIINTYIIYIVFQKTRKFGLEPSLRKKKKKMRSTFNRFFVSLELKRFS
jgi:hypothetical protein